MGVPGVSNSLLRQVYLRVLIGKKIARRGTPRKGCLRAIVDRKIDIIRLAASAKLAAIGAIIASVTTNLRVGLTRPA